MQFESQDDAVKWECENNVCSVCRTKRWTERKSFPKLRKLLGKDTEIYHGCAKIPIFCKHCKTVSHYGCSCDVTKGAPSH